MDTSGIRHTQGRPAAPAVRHGARIRTILLAGDIASSLLYVGTAVDRVVVARGVEGPPQRRCSAPDEPV